MRYIALFIGLLVLAACESSSESSAPGRITKERAIAIAMEAHFPEDLAFQQTGDRTNFQGRYILRHPWTGEAKCNAARTYLKSLDTRYRTEAENLASLTGWDIQDIYKKMNFRPTDGNKKWWQKIWQ